MARYPEAVPTAQSLTFRTAYGLPVFWLLVMGAAVAALGWIARAGAPDEHELLRQAHWVLAAGWGACCLGALLLWRERVTLDAVGLHHRSLWRNDDIPWGDVEEVAASFGGFFRSPSVALHLRRCGRPHSALGRDPTRFVLGLHWMGLDRLIAEVVARASRARVSDTTREWLAATHRVPWRYRLGPLLACVVSACLLVYALGALVALAASPVVAVPCGFAAAIVCGLLGGGAIDYEWRWKSWLVRAMAFLAPVVPLAGWPLLVFGRGGLLTMALAVALGWAVATTVVCLPVRPRGWQAAAGYVVAIAATSFAAWWLGVREPLPCRATRSVFPPVLWQEWSPDGRLLCGLGLWQNRKETPVCHVIDAASLAVRSFPLSQSRAWGLRPAGPRHALYYGTRRKDDKAHDARLWAVELSTGRETLVHSAPWSLASEGFMSADGQEAVFLAGTRELKEIAILRLSDLSTRRLDTAADVSRFSSVRWRPDGGLLLTERQWGESAEVLALWRLELGKGEPTALYRAAGKGAHSIHLVVSPDVRWAVVGAAGGGAELVDLADGRSKALDPQPTTETLAPCGWAPDGAAFAYVARAAGQNVLVVVRPSSGETLRPYATGLDIRSVALSRSGRYAAIETQRLLAHHVLVVDTSSGRVFRPRGIAMLPSLCQLAWSPAEQLLAVDRTGGLGGGELSSRLHLYGPAP